MLHKKWFSSVEERLLHLCFFKKRLHRMRRNQLQNHDRLPAASLMPLGGQRNLPAAAMHYGKYPLSWNGCEIIAVYNVLVFLKMPVPLAQMILEFELNRLYYFLPSCFFGSHPKKIQRFLLAHHVPFSGCHTSFTAFQNAFDPAHHTCGIISFWNNSKKKHRFNFFSGGLHTVAFQVRADGLCLVYNLHARDTAPLPLPSVRHLLADRRFIAGYWF